MSHVACGLYQSLNEFWLSQAQRLGKYISPALFDVLHQGMSSYEQPEQTLINAGFQPISLKN